MEDYSGLKAAIPAAPVSGRIWSVPKKRRAEDRSSSGGDQKRDASEKEEKEGVEEEHGPEDKDAPEETCYGSHGFRRKKNRKVDVII